MRLPLVPTGLCLALAAALRLARAGQLALIAPLHPPLGLRPLHRPPLLDLLTAALAPERRELLAVASGVLVVWLAGLLALRGLGPRGAVATMALTAALPPLIDAGAFWSYGLLLVPLALATALALVRALDGRSAIPLLFATALLAAADWTGWAPALAWAIWLVAFAPAWLPADRARAASRALLVGLLLAAPLYAYLLAQGADPHRALGWGRTPTGLAALQAHGDALASLLLGRTRHLPTGARVAAALVTITLVSAGWRAARTDPANRPWAATLLAGTAGSYAVALIVHPWIPVAAEKSLWYMSPMVLMLALTALQRLRPAPALAAALVLVGAGCDADGDGWSQAAGDCRDDAEGVHPEAPEIWNDGVDNDCDGLIDDSPDYRFVTEQEPNDLVLADCFAPSGQDLGDVAAFGLLNRLTGRIDSVVDASYDQGDLDCYLLRFPEDSGHVRLEVNLSWPNPDSDLDFAVQGLWEGAQSGFALADQPGPGPEVAVTTSGFDGGAPLWLWIVGYSGAPTDYTVDLVLR